MVGFLLLIIRTWSARGLVCLVVCCLLEGHSLAGEYSRATYIVKPGDVLGVIASRREIRLAHLIKVNRLKSADEIRSGQVLVLPSVYRVADGDVLGTIAERHHVNIGVLCEDNDLTADSVLQIGQPLLIAGGYLKELPGPTRPSAESPPPSTERIETQGASKTSKTKSHSLSEPTKSQSQASNPRVSESAPARKQTAEPESVKHRVRRGEVLSVIAQRFRVPVSQLQKLNGVGKGAIIRIGQTLKVPVTDANRHITRPPPPKAWHRYTRKNFTRGYIKLRAPGRQWNGHVLDKRGNLIPRAKRGIHSMLGAWRPNQRIALSPRLIRLIVQVSDEFGGRAIRVVSGYRRFSHATHSKHKVGRALDFSIPGVPNEMVRDFLLTLPNVGVGYYPNSTHVHMDDRPYRMYWVDVSKPGQAPRYVHKSRTGKKRGAGWRATTPKRNTPKTRRIARLQSRERG